MGHAQSAQHNFHQHAHPHHRGYLPHPHRVHGPSPGGGSAGEGSSEAEDGPRWSTHSFPRDHARRAGRGHPQPLQLAPENRVLPMVMGPPPKLRSTNNGNILQNGGTISNRKLSQSQLVSPVKAYRARHDPRMQHGPPGSRPSSRQGGGGQLSGSRARFGGSEPDLRAPSPRHQGPPPPSNHARPSPRTPASAAAAAAARKKYKAPPPPQAGIPGDSESPSDTTWEEGGSGAPRRPRLFKTRAQTNGSPALNRPREEPDPPRALGSAAANFLAQRSVSSPEFQMELVRAAQRRHQERQQQVSTPPQQQPAQQHIQQKQQQRESPTPAGPRHAPVGRESSGEGKEHTVRSRSPASERVSKVMVRVPAPAPPATPKTFYFGMEVGSGQAEEDEVDRFAARLQRTPRMRARSSSPGSGVSGSGEEDRPLRHGDIAMQLRPTLPKKTPDIPRFSPTAAWRQLLIEPLPCRDQEDDSDNEDSRRTPVLRGGGGTAALLEERIVQSLLQRAPLTAVARGSVATHEKSGDSGISGDASPGPGATLLDSPDPAPVPHPRNRRHHATPQSARQWTPEQDLDETSSEDERRSPRTRSPHQQRRTVSEERTGETAFRGERGRSGGRVTPPKFTRRSHMFSLSLPRPDQMQNATRTYDDTTPPLESPESPDGNFHSLQKLRKSAESNQQLSLDENWYLSRSAPNSLDSSGAGEAAVWGPRALSAHHVINPEPIEDEVDVSPPSSSTPGLSYVANGGHIMYLPEYDSRRVNNNFLRPIHAGQRSKSVDALTAFHNKENLLSVVHSHEAPQEMKEKRPESPWGEVIKEPPKTTPQITPSGKSGKRFTFQSTIRQIERRRIADRLSREAERKEQQRRQEAEAMRRVEEDFQRKRAREKASLKEQLRLFSLQDTGDGPHSLPAQLIETAPPRTRGCRVEPEGAVGAKVVSQVDKEPHSRSKQEPREYRDYTASPVKVNSRYPSGERISPAPPASPASGGGARRGVMQHPPAVFDIPKSGQVFVSTHQTITVNGPVVVGDIPRGGGNADQHNYRREFARGAIPGLSPRSNRVPRARLTQSSPTPQEQDSGASRGHETNNNFTSLPAHQQQAPSTALPRLQPFGAARSKAYRPIAFKPSGGNSTSGPKSTAKLAQAVS